MRGSNAVLEKELAEHFASKRFLLMFALILLSGAGAAFASAQSLTAQGLTKFASQYLFLVLFSGAASSLPSYVYFLSILAPILGIALGFDSINRELASGSMVRLLSNPIHRDSVIVGKLAAGLIVISVVVGGVNAVIVGADILLAGYGPGLDTALRIFYFTVVTILYSAVWFSLAMFLSTVFRRAATSALVSLALWIFLSFFIYPLATGLAAVMAPLPTYPAPTIGQMLANMEITRTIARISPAVIYGELSSVLLNPQVRSLAAVYVYSPELPIPASLTVDESLALSLPHISALVAAFSLFSILAYLAFMRMEIRARWE